MKKKPATKRPRTYKVRWTMRDTGEIDPCEFTANQMAAHIEGLTRVMHERTRAGLEIVRQRDELREQYEEQRRNASALFDECVALRKEANLAEKLRAELEEQYRLRGNAEEVAEELRTRCQLAEEGEKKWRDNAHNAAAEAGKLQRRVDSLSASLDAMDRVLSNVVRTAVHASRGV